jgi:hypothetical protein
MNKMIHQTAYAVYDNIFIVTISVIDCSVIDRYTRFLLEVNMTFFVQVF